MCCGADEVLGLPPAVIEMLARYRRLRDEQGFGWGEEALPDLFRWSRFSVLGPAFDEFAQTGDWATAVRAAVREDSPPAGVAVVSIAAGRELTVRPGPRRVGLAGRPRPVDVLLLSAADGDLTVSVGDVAVPVPACGVGLRTVDVDAADPTIRLRCDGHQAAFVALDAASAARLRLSAPACSRWSVTDGTGGAWFPDGVPAKWDVAHRPYWHGQDLTLDVPAGPLHVVVARGLEFQRAEFDLHVDAGQTTELAWHPERRFDPGADGWFGGDLHVHLNYSGDHVLEPADAARMQAGEGLHVLQLNAGNLGGALVYDRELLDSTAGHELWSGERVAVAGLEFRNDLLGHVHGLGLTATPRVLQTGHPGTDHPHDWPPNSVALAELRRLGALTSYAHPVFTPLDEVAQLFGPARSVEARELVADAALGVVDAIEVVSCFDDGGAVVLWHHLLNCGLRIAAVAGTDAFLSFAHGPGVASNPPGWGRVYARLGEQPLTAAEFAAAVRAGRTVVTNGPWLSLEVDGDGPGAVLERRPGERLDVRATVQGSGVDRLVLYGPDGEVAATTGDELRHVVTADRGSWLAAAAHGGDDPHTLGAPVFAHTSPVYVDVAGRSVARATSARWCLRALDALEALVTAEGQFDPARRGEQLGDLVAVVDQARAFYRGVAEEAG
jgi:hypothetical protein